MASWLKDFRSVRVQPRLWVETLWLVESREPLVFTRTIDLHPGLNIVWAKESSPSEASGLASAGHGVGKTSLCLLLRYVLGDEAPAIATLRAKAAAAFPRVVWLPRSISMEPLGLSSGLMAVTATPWLPNVTSWSRWWEGR